MAQAYPLTEAVAPAGVAGLKASRLEPRMMSAADGRLADANKRGRQLSTTARKARPFAMSVETRTSVELAPGDAKDIP